MPCRSGAALAALVLLALPGPADAAGQGRQCAGIAGLPCDRGLWCDLQPGICKGADLSGICVRSTDTCPEIFMPVCGCDARTYPNDCVRRYHRMQKAHEGECSRAERKHRW